MIENRKIRNFLLPLFVALGAALALGLSFYLIIFIVPIMIITSLCLAAYVWYKGLSEKRKYPPMPYQEEESEVIDVEYEIIEEDDD